MHVDAARGGQAWPIVGHTGIRCRCGVECGFLTWSVLCGGCVLCGSVEGSACQGDEILLLLMFLLGLADSKLLPCITYFTFTQSLMT